MWLNILHSLFISSVTVAVFKLEDCNGLDLITRLALEPELTTDVLLEYSYEIYNELNDFLDVAHYAGESEEIVNDLLNIIEKYNMTYYVGVLLLHKHFGLNFDEKLIETRYSNMSISRVYKEDLGNNNGKKFAIRFSLTHNGSLIPLQYSVYNEHSNDIYKKYLYLIDNNNKIKNLFLKEFSTKLYKLNLLNTFGLQLSSYYEFDNYNNNNNNNNYNNRFSESELVTSEEIGTIGASAPSTAPMALPTVNVNNLPTVVQESVYTLEISDINERTLSVYPESIADYDTIHDISNNNNNNNKENDISSIVFWTRYNNKNNNNNDDDNESEDIINNNNDVSHAPTPRPRPPTQPPAVIDGARMDISDAPTPRPKPPTEAPTPPAKLAPGVSLAPTPRPKPPTQAPTPEALDNRPGVSLAPTPRPKPPTQAPTPEAIVREPGVSLAPTPKPKPPTQGPTPPAKLAPGISGAPTPRPKPPTQEPTPPAKAGPPGISDAPTPRPKPPTQAPTPPADIDK